MIDNTTPGKRPPIDPYYIFTISYTDDDATISTHMEKMQRMLRDSSDDAERDRRRRAMDIMTDPAERRQWLDQLVRDYVAEPVRVLVGNVDEASDHVLKTYIEQTMDDLYSWDIKLRKQIIQQAFHILRGVAEKPVASSAEPESAASPAQETGDDDTTAEPEAVGEDEGEAGQETSAGTGFASAAEDGLGRSTSSGDGEIASIKQYRYDPFDWKINLRFERITPKPDPDDEFVLCAPDGSDPAAREDETKCPNKIVWRQRAKSVAKRRDVIGRDFWSLALMPESVSGRELNKRTYHLFLYRSLTKHYHFLLTLAKPHLRDRHSTPTAEEVELTDGQTTFHFVSVVWDWPNAPSSHILRHEVHLENEADGHRKRSNDVRKYSDYTQPNSVLLPDPWEGQGGKRIAVIKDGRDNETHLGESRTEEEGPIPPPPPVEPSPLEKCRIYWRYQYESATRSIRLFIRIIGEPTGVEELRLVKRERSSNEWKLVGRAIPLSDLKSDDQSQMVTLSDALLYKDPGTEDLRLRAKTKGPSNVHFEPEPNAAG